MKPHERSPAKPRHPAVMDLIRRRRQVLYLRAYGYDYDQIATTLDIPKATVHKDLISIGRTWIPKGAGLPPATKQPQVMYILGLLDGGLSPEEALAQLRSLPDRVAWLQMRTDDEARTVPETGDSATPTVAQ